MKIILCLILSSFTSSVTAFHENVLRELEEVVSNPGFSIEKKIDTLQYHQSEELLMEAGGPLIDKAGFRPYITRFLHALSDIEIKFYVVDDTPWGLTTFETVTGIHTGPMLGLKATGREVGFTLIHTQEFQDGKIKRQWTTGDYTLLKKQLMGEMAGRDSYQLAAPVILADEAAGDCESPSTPQELHHTWLGLKSIMEGKFDEVALEKLLSDNYRLTTTYALNEDRDGFIRRLKTFVKIFKESDLSDLEVKFITGDTLVLYGKRHALYNNPTGLLQYPPGASSEAVSFTENHIIRVCEGKIYRHYFYVDGLRLIEQLKK